MGGQGVGDRAANPPPPWVHQPALCRCRLLPRPRALNGEREGQAMRRPETAGHTIPYHTPPPPHPLSPLPPFFQPPNSGLVSWRVRWR